MKFKARKVGNSLSITIPSFVANTLNIKNGDELDIELEKKKIIIRKEIKKDE